MKISELIRLALLNVIRRWRSTVLTIIGVVIGTTCIVLMFSIGLTNSAGIDSTIHDKKLTVIEVTQREVQNAKALDSNAIDAIGQIEHVTGVLPVRFMQVYAETGRYSGNLQITAVPLDKLSYIVKLKKGCYPNPDSAMPEIIMGKAAAKHFLRKGSTDPSTGYEGPDLDWLGLDIDFYPGGEWVKEDLSITGPKHYRARVVGIVDGGDEPSNDIYMCEELLDTIICRNYALADSVGILKNNYDKAFLFVDSADHVKAVIAAVEEYGFDTVSDVESIEQLKAQQKQQQSQLGAIGLITLIVSAIGIANTMIAGILERRSDIGVMKVVGMPITKIRLLFLIESAIIGLVGGLAGILLSHIIAYLISTAADSIGFLGMQFSSGTKLAMPLWLDAGAAAVAVAVGVISGVLPAVKAANMAPMDVLRR
mgnify:CR=1 FL=1